jgi:hypothetical protein
MYELLDAHPATLVVVMAALMVTPLHLLATYVFSGASARKGAIVAAVTLTWGAFMVWFCLAQVVQRSGPLGNLYVPLLWAAPSLLVWLARDWLLAEPLSQRWLIGLQLWRVIGALFLVEMARGQLPAVFALPAGIGDVAVALLAAVVLWRGRGKSVLPIGAVIAVLALGIADFISAFFFGFFSSAGPQQLFFPQVPNRALLFPTGLIPLFLVPYAIAFHTLSWLTLRRQRQDITRGMPRWAAGGAA